MNQDTNESDVLEQTSEETLAILKARAVALSKEPKKTEDSSDYLQVVEFLLAHERYSLDLAHIREVISLKELTPIPGAPPFVLGVINLRGQIISVINLKKFFDLPDTEATSSNRVIILESEDMEFGILSDQILGIKAIPFNIIQPSLPTLTAAGSQYLKGVTPDRMVILDGGKILADKGIIVDKGIDY